jgi:hypothetical protein
MTNILTQGPALGVGAAPGPLAVWSSRSVSRKSDPEMVDYYKMRRVPGIIYKYMFLVKCLI